MYGTSAEPVYEDGRLLGYTWEVWHGFVYQTLPHGNISEVFTTKQAATDGLKRARRIACKPFDGSNGG